MRHLFTLLAVAAVVGMSSCSSSRSTQTTDDLYYSSGSTSAAGSGKSSRGANQGDYYSTAPSDNYVRMKAEDQSRWSYFDDYGAYDSYYAPSASIGYGWGYPSYAGAGFGYGLGFGYGMGLGFYDPYMAWNSYFMWNSWYNPYFYNPYYGGAVFVTGHSAGGGAYTNLRPFNQVAYRNGLSHTTRTTNSTGSRFYRPGMSTTSNYNSGLNGQGSRPVNNTYYRPGNNTNNNGGFRPSVSQPSRSFTPASSGGGGGGGFSRPGRH